MNYEGVKINICGRTNHNIRRVANKSGAPPTFEASTCARIKGIGDTLKTLNTEIVTGTMSKIVVTLSMNIEVTAVNVHNINISFHKFALLALLALTATY